MNWQWQNKADQCKAEGTKITMVAGPETNLFNSPTGYFKCCNFPFMYTEWEGDFIALCKVKPEFQTVYDLGSIVVWNQEDVWIKFAYEKTDSGNPAIVSVVISGYSDDCNGPNLEGEVWLQINRKGDVFALHYSLDGINWLLARICRVSMDKKVRIGLSVQSPSGKQCKVFFENFELRENTYSNQRKCE